MITYFVSYFLLVFFTIILLQLHILGKTHGNDIGFVLVYIMG